MDAPVTSLAVYDDGGGGGPALYAGGSFSTAGGVAAKGIARWNGSAWADVGSSLGSAAAALTVFDDGTGPALVAGGWFLTAGGVAVNRIARWDGSAWSTLGAGMDGVVEALTVHDDGTGGGATLLAGGDFTVADGPARRIARWDGGSWSALGSGMNRAVHAVALFPAVPGGSPVLWAGGEFDLVEGMAMYYAATFDDGSWSALGQGFGGRVFALQAFDDGSGLSLFAGGDFDAVGGAKTSNVAKWDGSTWSPLGTGVSGLVGDFAVFDDGQGGGPALYAAGWFGLAGGETANNIARWNGQDWSPLANGLSDRASTLAVFDDGSGSGPALYVGGDFTTASGVPARFIARWDGTSWSTLGFGANSRVLALTVLDDGQPGGPALYAGGWFQTMNGQLMNHVAKWDGATWSALGGGLANAVYALTVFDDGGGPTLHAGGFFHGGLPNVAKWDGNGWSAVGSGVSGTVRALGVFDDGTGQGPALYAGGQFLSAGSLAVNNIARWDGTDWSALGSGLDGSGYALRVYDDHQGGGRALYVGGGGSAPDSGDQYLARWGHSPSPWNDVGGGTRGLSGPPRLSLDGPLTPNSTLTLDLVGAAPLAPAVLFVAVQSRPQPFLGGILHAFPTSELAVLTTSTSGEIHRAALFPGAMMGTSLWLQVAIADLSVPDFGASLSNAVKGAVP